MLAILGRVECCILNDLIWQAGRRRQAGRGRQQSVRSTAVPDSQLELPWTLGPLDPFSCSAQRPAPGPNGTLDPELGKWHPEIGPCMPLHPGKWTLTA